MRGAKYFRTGVKLARNARLSDAQIKNLTDMLRQLDNYQSIGLDLRKYKWSREMYLFFDKNFEELRTFSTVISSTRRSTASLKLGGKTDTDNLLESAARKAIIKELVRLNVGGAQGLYRLVKGIIFNNKTGYINSNQGYFVSVYFEFEAGTGIMRDEAIALDGSKQTLAHLFNSRYSKTIKNIVEGRPKRG